MFEEIYYKLCSSRMPNEKYKKFSGLHKHHVKPRHAGGEDKAHNFCYLTIREHIIAHYLLWRINGDVNDLRAMHILNGHLTPLQRSIIGKWCAENGIGFHGYSKKDKIEWAKRGAAQCIKNKSGIHTKDAIARSEWASLGGKASIQKRKEQGLPVFIVSSEAKERQIKSHNEYKRSCICMHIPGSGKYKRIRKSEVDAYLSNGWKLGMGIGKPRNSVKVKKVIVEDKVFKSKGDAAEFYGISEQIVGYRCRHQKKYPDWVFGEWHHI